MAKISFKTAVASSMIALAGTGLFLVGSAPTAKLKFDAAFFKSGKSYSCKVLYVNDGDTFKAKFNDTLEASIRLNSIDAPELKQQFGPESKQWLAAALTDKTLIVKLASPQIDKYGRLIADVYTDGIHINFMIVNEGMAFAYPKYCKDFSIFQAEAFAQANNLGVHSIKLLRPWLFRKQ